MATKTKEVLIASLQNIYGGHQTKLFWPQCYLDPLSGSMGYRLFFKQCSIAENNTHTLLLSSTGNADSVHVADYSYLQCKGTSGIRINRRKLDIVMINHIGSRAFGFAIDKVNRGQKSVKIEPRANGDIAITFIP